MKLENIAGVRGVKGLARRVAWPFTSKETVEKIKLVERQKILLTLALQNDHLLLSREIKKYSEAIEADVKDVVRVLGFWKWVSDVRDHSISRYAHAPVPLLVVSKIFRTSVHEISLWLFQLQKVIAQTTSHQVTIGQIFSDYTQMIRQSFLRPRLFARRAGAMSELFCHPRATVSSCGLV